MLTIIIECYDCNHKNRQELGMPGYELVQSTFESYSEAWQHMMANPDHHMAMSIREDNDE